MRPSIYNLCHCAVFLVCFILGDLAFVYNLILPYIIEEAIFIDIQSSFILLSVLLLLETSSIYLSMISLLTNSPKLWKYSTTPIHNKSFVALRETVLNYLAEEDHDAKDYLKWVRIALFCSVSFVLLFIVYILWLPM